MLQIQSALVPSGEMWGLSLVHTETTLKVVGVLSQIVVMDLCTTYWYRSEDSRVLIEGALLLHGSITPIGGC